MGVLKSFLEIVNLAERRTITRIIRLLCLTDLHDRRIRGLCRLRLRLQCRNRRLGLANLRHLQRLYSLGSERVRVDDLTVGFDNGNPGTREGVSSRLFDFLPVLKGGDSLNHAVSWFKGGSH